MREGNVQGLQNRCEGIRALDDLRPTVLDKAPPTIARSGSAA
jgi:hypothetical protein